MKSFLSTLIGATVILILFSVSSIATIDAGLSAEQMGPHWADTELAKTGLKAFNKAGCANCHNIMGQQGQVSGPPLDWIGERYPQDMIEKIIRNPRDFYPNTIMPKVHSIQSDENIALIAEYLASFKRN